MSNKRRKWVGQDISPAYVTELEAELKVQNDVIERQQAEYDALELAGRRELNKRTTQRDEAERELAELREAATEVHRISERDHEAWHKLAALLEVKDAPEAPRIKTTWQADWERGKGYSK